MPFKWSKELMILPVVTANLSQEDTAGHQVYRTNILDKWRGHSRQVTAI